MIGQRKLHDEMVSLPTKLPMVVILVLKTSFRFILRLVVTRANY